MEDQKEKIFSGLSQAVVDMDIDSAVYFARKALEAGISAEEAIVYGLSNGMERVSKLYQEDIYYVPELVVCGDTMYEGLNILKPHLNKTHKPLGKLIIGVVEGDSHDIGKNIVAMLLEAAGFEIHDLGTDVPLHHFADKALEVDADIVAMSSLMTTSRGGMGNVIEDLKKRSLRKRFVMVGGSAVTAAFAQRIGADAYGPDAFAAVTLAKKMMLQF